MVEEDNDAGEEEQHRQLRPQTESTRVIISFWIQEVPTPAIFHQPFHGKYLLISLSFHRFSAPFKILRG